MFTIMIDNFRALRHFHWTPPEAEVSVLVGPNGAGKSTLIIALRFIKIACERNFHDSVINILGGSYNLRNSLAGIDDPVAFGIELDGLTWRIRLIPRGSTVDLADESLSSGSQVIYERTSLGKATYLGQPFPADDRLGVRAIADANPPDAEATRVTGFLRGIGMLMDINLTQLRMGSQAEDNRELSSRGTNAISVLRFWHDRRDLRNRFDFVRDGLIAAFRGLCSDLDFDPSPTTVSMRFFRPHTDEATHAANEANGVLAMLAQLCAIAATPQGGLVCIDEPENSLHPFAIRQLVRSASAWARQNSITVFFSTHSPVLLDEMNGTPDRVYVLDPMADEQPVRLDKHKDPRWLSRFRLGELYENCEYGCRGEGPDSGNSAGSRSKNAGKPKTRKNVR